MRKLTSSELNMISGGWDWGNESDGSEFGGASIGSGYGFGGNRGREFTHTYSYSGVNRERLSRWRDCLESEGITRETAVDAISNAWNPAAGLGSIFRGTVAMSSCNSRMDRRR